MVNLDKYKNSIHRIIGNAFKVYNSYRGGLLESAYEAALVYLLRQDQFVVDEQKELPLYFEGIRLNRTYRMDIVLNNQIILELKAVKEITPEHRHQLFNYLRLTHMPIGLLLNFTLEDGVIFEKYYYDVETNYCHPFK